MGQKSNLFSFCAPCPSPWPSSWLRYGQGKAGFPTDIIPGCDPYHVLCVPYVEMSVVKRYIIISFFFLLDFLWCCCASLSIGLELGLIPGASTTVLYFFCLDLSGFLCILLVFTATSQSTSSPGAAPLPNRVVSNPGLVELSGLHLANISPIQVALSAAIPLRLLLHRHFYHYLGH